MCLILERRSRASWLKSEGGRCLPFSALLHPTWRSALSLPLFPSSSHLQQVVNPRAALLSNYEVLQLLRELETDHIARTRIAQRLKKEEEDAAAPTGHPVSENLRTIEVEVRPVSCYQCPRHFLMYPTYRPSSTSLQIINRLACRPPRASNASRKTSLPTASPRSRNSKSST
jgi:hypothetical protein